MSEKEKIRAEVERLKNDLIQAEVRSKIEMGRISAFEDILLYIDSLPERIKAEDVIEVPELTELEKKAKKYAIEQVICSTNTRMTEQAYLSIRIFNGYDVACAYKDGAENQREQMMKDAFIFERKHNIACVLASECLRRHGFLNRVRDFNDLLRHISCVNKPFKGEFNGTTKLIAIKEDCPA